MNRQSKNRLCILAALIIISCLPVLISAQSKWTDISVPLHETITGISFISPSTGYIVTSGAKYARTTDSGKTWKAFTLYKNDPSYDDIYFLNRDSGIICGRYGFVARTTDGCKTWEPTFYGDTSIWFTSVVMLGGGKVVIAGLIPGDVPKGVAFHSVDGGLNWSQLPDLGFGYGELFYRKGDPLCFQSWGKLHYSLDSGKTWSTLLTGSGKTGRATAFFGQTGIICGNLAMLKTSSDRGKTWNNVQMDKPDIHFTSVVLVDESTGYIAGTGGTVMKTIDGGKVWAPETVRGDQTDYACMRLAGDYLYLGGIDGIIMKTKVK